MIILTKEKYLESLFTILKNRYPTSEELSALLIRYQISTEEELDVSGVALSNDYQDLQNKPLLNLMNLTDVNLLNLNIGELISWSGTNWVNIAQPVEEFVEATLANTQQLPAGVIYQDITIYDSPDINTVTGGTFNSTTGIFTVTTAGLYRFEFQTTLDQYDGNNRTSARIRLALNGALVKGTEQIGYHRQNLHGFGSYSFTRTLSLIPGDQVVVQARNEDATRDHQLLANSTLFRITKIKQ